MNILSQVFHSKIQSALAYNLPAQLLFQQLIRTAADGGRLVIATAPFENMTTFVDGFILWEKMRWRDFAGYDIDLTYVLLTGDEREVEEEIRRRLIERGRYNAYQAKLDAKKIADPNYYAKRAQLVRESVKSRGFGLIEDCLADDDRDPIAVADRVADAIIASVSV